MFVHIAPNRLPIFLFHTSQYYIEGCIRYNGLWNDILYACISNDFEIDIRKKESCDGKTAALIQCVKREISVMGVGILNIFGKGIGDNRFHIMYMDWK